MALNFLSAIISRIPRFPTITSTHPSPILQPPHPCPDCTCDQQPPAPTLFQPASQHRRFCLRHHLTPAQDANARIFKSDHIKNGFKTLFYGGLRFNNDEISRLHINNMQHQALRSWEKLQLPLGESTSIRLPLGDSISTPFPLIPVFDIYNDYFFCGALCGRVDVVWMEECEGEGRKGYTVDADGPGHRATIFIKRPLLHHAGWTKLLVKEVLQTLLHEMIHALFNVYECRCASCTTAENRAVNTGVSGHGPNWRELGMAVQEEAERMFEGGWELDLDAGLWGGGHVEEVRTVLEMRKVGRIGCIDGVLLDALLK